MRRSLQHKRFIVMGNEQLSVSGCYWYVQMLTAIDPIGNVNDSMHKRPCFILL